MTMILMRTNHTYTSTFFPFCDLHVPNMNITNIYFLHTIYCTECGVPRITLQKRIIGGNEAYFGEFPWQAHIRIAGYQCGGVLVSRWYVATAAHCIHRSVWWHYC
jgi:hypothetical protein